MKTVYTILVLFISVNSLAIEINKTVEVNSVTEFFTALDDNTEIIIQSDTLNFTLENLEKELGIKESSEYWHSHNEPIKRDLKSYYLASGVILNGYQHLIIRSENQTAIISDNDYDNILSFKNCKDVVLEGVSIFHTPSTCNGAVLSILLSSNIRVNNCSLNGSGGFGATLIGARKVQFTNVNIFNNTFYAIYAINSSNIKFENCNMYDNHDWGKSVIYSDISYLVFKNCHIYNNQSNNLIYSSLGSPPFVNFENCDIEYNPFDFDLQEFIEDSSHEDLTLSKKGKREAMLKLFVTFLSHELRSDYDNRNIEFISFFNDDYEIKYKAQKSRSAFLSLYFNLKKNGFKIESYKISGNTIVINQSTENQYIWSFYFNKSNKFRKIKIK